MTTHSYNNQMEIGNVISTVKYWMGSTVHCNHKLPHVMFVFEQKCKNARQVGAKISNPNTIWIIPEPKILKMKRTQTWEEVDNFQWYAHLTLFSTITVLKPIQTARSKYFYCPVNKTCKWLQVVVFFLGGLLFREDFFFFFFFFFFLSFFFPKGKSMYNHIKI